MQTFQIIPTTPTGYALNHKRGAISVVIPEATVNLITNPSFETNTTSWAVTGGGTTLTRTNGAGLFGSYAMSVTYGAIGTSKGARYTFGASVALSGIYTASAYVHAPMGMTLALVVNSVTVASAVGRGSGVWIRLVGQPIPISTAGSATVDVLRTAGGAAIDSFMVDGVQLEQKAYATTYCDGDQQGFVSREIAYLWAGLAHGSTSQRLTTTRAGGKIISLDDVGFSVLSLVGLGMPPFSVIATPVAQGGAYFQTTIPQTRTFSLVGVISATSEQMLDQQRSTLMQHFSPQRLRLPQPLRLIYRNYAQDGVTPLSEECDLICHYSGGLEGQRSGLFQDRSIPEFQMFQPYLSRLGWDSQALAVQELVADADYIIQRDRDGDYAILSASLLAGGWQAAVEGDDGYRYVGGVFNSIGAIANTAGIARYDLITGAWSAVGTGADTSGNVDALAKLADGSIIAVGSFLSMSGVANTRFIAKWTPSTATWSSIGTTTGGAGIDAVVVAPNGDLYVGGIFTTIGGVAAANVARYNGSVWSALGSGPNGTVLAVAISQDGTQVTIGGNFTSAGGVANTNRIATWSTTASTWSALSTGMNGDVNALLYGPNQALYVGGLFSTAGGVTANGLAVWNGTAFFTLGGSLSSGGQAVDFSLDLAGSLHITGNFTTAGRVPTPYGYAIWTGSTFIPGDIIPATGATLDYSQIFPNGDIWLSYFGTGTSITAVNTTITYDGTAPSYSTFTITGPTSGAVKALSQIVNETTDVGIYFDLDLLVGEIVTLDLDPRSPTYGLSSSSRGNLVASVLAGSNLADWTLQPGDNLISVFCEDSTMTVTATWRVNYLGIQDAVLR